MVALALAAGIAACDDDGGGGGDQVESIDVGYAFGFDVGDTADRIAFDRMAESTGIEPEFTETGGGDEAIAALNKGDIDMAKITTTDSINPIAQGAEIESVLVVNPHLDLILASQPDLETLADLRGKKILLDRPGPSVSEAELKLVLKRAGLGEDDYEIGYLPDSQNRAAALASGRADAATLETVDLELARAQGAELNELEDLGALVPEPSAVFVVRRDFAEDNPDLLNQVVGGLLAGFESMYGPEGRDAWIARAREEDLADQPEEVAARIYDDERKLGYWVRGAPLTEAEYEKSQDFLAENGAVETPVPFDQAWDTSFWENATGG